LRLAAAKHFGADWHIVKKHYRFKTRRLGESHVAYMYSSVKWVLTRVNPQ
jgi:hypothetical protein